MRNDARDVERLFIHLVRTLGKASPARPRTTFQVSELYQEIIPYRTHRSKLGLDSNQDYEMAVLRLLAGEGGYATVEPEEVQAALADEAGQRNPDPGTFREYAGAIVRLVPGAVAKVLDTERAFAPPDASPEDRAPLQFPVREAEGSAFPTPPPFALDEPAVGPGAAIPADASPADRTSAADSPTCKHCGRALPLHRPVTYCPFCGEHAHALVCKACGADLESGWQFCVECGEPLASRRRSGG